MTDLSSTYSALEAALRERLEVIADREHCQHDPAGHLARLQSASERVVALGKEIAGNADPRLMHFLERCSYDKALAFLLEARRG